ncbi:hypothetical protein AAG570_007332 [Ranatra chinensis]|uniref:Exportin-2 n=1 Tax=Ranatra chinensis TaxID=642074 RepID=A0ABD0XVK2_9HEMI
MELSDANLVTLSEYLLKTLSPDPSVRRPSEKFLESVEGNKNYPVLLLHLVNKAEIDLTIRVAGAVTFKNYVKRNWHLDDDGTSRVDESDREEVKRLIVDIMLVAPAPVQKQLSDAISIIGKSDFPLKWTGLIAHMVDKFNTGDFHVINGILHTAHSLFKRYRYEFKSQALWTEIKFVLQSFCEPLTKLFEVTYGLTSAHANNPEVLRIVYSSLLLICKIFYSLNFQDLPEFFEDNMNIWMPHFNSLLATEVKCLESDSNDEPGLIEQLKSQVCFNVSLYAQKYDEEFQPYMPKFVTDIWNLLVSTGLQPKYDQLVSHGLQFLSTVADRIQYRELFQDPNVLTSICEKVIIPNIQFREVDEELFADNPEEYMRRDIEGSDVETRRRAACDLVKVLSQHFEEKITAIFSQYVQAMLNEYTADRGKWKAKNAAVYLVISMAGKGQTQKHGVTQVSSLVPLQEFAAQYIIPELETDVNGQAVVKADSIKYLLQFRSILPPEVVVGSLGAIVRHLRANSQVVHSYAASAVDRILTLRQNNVLIVTGEKLVPLAGELLPALFNCLSMRGSEENEYVMKAIMRSFSTLQEAVIPYLGDLLPKLTEKLAVAARNPSKPHFNHYLFETITLSINIVCKKTPEAVQSFEEALFPIFQVILQQDVQEFLPYVLQVLSMLLGLRSSGEVPGPYLALYPCLLAPVLWERPGNIRPLASLLRGFVQKSRVSPATKEVIKVSGLLGVFQKLISSKANDHEGFYLIQAMMEFMPKEDLDPYMKQVMMLLFQRLSSSKTTKFIRGVLVFFCFYVITYGASEFVVLVDSVQPQMFVMIVERLFVPDTQKISGSSERKIAAVGITKLITEAKQIIDGPYSNTWPNLLKTLIQLFELPEDQTDHPDDHYVEVEDTPGYDVAYSRLVYAGDPSAEHDPLSGKW